ncbi:hypothetical protein GF386_06110 [Candidatus Pacearchaeota archaeon]|nr:hypothetical protein [Candidatus Pacearchaeota archaeon]MBD3283663.1 hypothetical protein [Candidatus Pacearchaeota archaeon]
MEKKDEISDIYKKTAAGVITILGFIVILTTSDTITGNIIGAQEIVKVSDIAAAVWGLIILFAGIYIGFLKQ